MKKRIIKHLPVAAFEPRMLQPSLHNTYFSAQPFSTLRRLFDTSPKANVDMSTASFQRSAMYQRWKR